MITILGAGGAVSDALVRALATGERAGAAEPIRLVSRTPALVPGAAETVAADLTRADDTARAVAGSRVVFLVAGLKYDLDSWRRQWPPIMRNAIEASKRAGARLVFFDNVYMYGAVGGPMTEETPFRPTSRKGEIRAEIATMLLDAMRSGSLAAMIARAADFYGPGARSGIPNVMVFDPLAAGKAAMWPVNVDVPHSCTYVPDAARALVQLVGRDDAWGQTWHLPTAGDPPTGRRYAELAAAALGAKPRLRELGRTMFRMVGLFDGVVREMAEMLYQYDRPYLFDSTKFTRAFGTEPTGYEEGIAASAQAAAASRRR